MSLPIRQYSLGLAFPLTANFTSTLCPGCQWTNAGVCVGSSRRDCSVEGWMQWVPSNNSSMSDSWDCCHSTDTPGMRTVNRCFEQMMTSLGLEWMAKFNSWTKRHYSGLIRCPWCGILLLKESARKCRDELHTKMPLNTLNIPNKHWYWSSQFWCCWLFS